MRSDTSTDRRPAPEAGYDKAGALVVDGHLDLAFNALHLRRDLSLPVEEVRRQDEPSVRGQFGTCTVTLPAMRRGRVGIAMGTVMVRVDAAGSYAGTGMRVQSQCYGVGRGHAAYYEALERSGEVRIIRTSRDLHEVEASWREAADTSRLPIGVVLAMESADPILDPAQVASWHDVGLRCASLCHYGVGAWAHGTGTEGGLFPGTAELLRAFRSHRIVLDVTHLADKAFWEALDLYDGPLIASHHNCRALVPGQRQLDDDMLKELIARGAVIGASFDLWMLDPRFVRGRTNPRRATLDAVVDHIEHVCGLAGSSLHAAVGSDMDGGYGVEQCPSDIDDIGGMGRLAQKLAARGFQPADVRNVLSGNWLRLLTGVLA